MRKVVVLTLLIAGATAAALAPDGLRPGAADGLTPTR
jgi:hypothetical protein